MRLITQHHRQTPPDPPQLPPHRQLPFPPSRPLQPPARLYPLQFSLHRQPTAVLTPLAYTAVTFPTAYAQPPLVVVSVINTSQGPEEVRNIVANPFNTTTTGFEIAWRRAEPDTNTYTTLTFSWLAFGGE